MYVLHIPCGPNETKGTPVYVYFQAVEKEMSTAVKWENFLVGLGEHPLPRNQEVKTLVRSGVPVVYRGRIWKEYAQLTTG